MSMVTFQWSLSLALTVLVLRESYCMHHNKNRFLLAWRCGKTPQQFVSQHHINSMELLFCFCYPLCLFSYFYDATWTTNPDVSCLALPLARRPTITPTGSDILSSDKSPSITG